MFFIIICVYVTLVMNFQYDYSNALLFSTLTQL